MQASQKLNFPTDKSVYSGLVPINVNDSVLELACPKVRRRKSFTRTDKDPEPVLTDYLTPIKIMSHIVPVSDIRADLTVRPPDTNNFERVYELLDALNCEY